MAHFILYKGKRNKRELSEQEMQRRKDLVFIQGPLKYMDVWLKFGHSFSKATFLARCLWLPKAWHFSWNLIVYHKISCFYFEPRIHLMSIVRPPNQLIISWRTIGCRSICPVLRLLELVTEVLTPSAPPFSWSRNIILLHKQTRILTQREDKCPIKNFVTKQSFLEQGLMLWIWLWNTLNLFGSILSTFAL